ncbi:MAG: energy transducer TonB [Candidatus Marinimicrobia bacterium]|nr:energy transducer TonB [Candidatus Neomarinimicrobiota bacterium]
MAIYQDEFAARYPLRVRFITAGVVGFLVVILYGFPRFLGEESVAIERIDEVVETIDIPPTQQLEIPPPPARPSIPVESEEDIAEDITIEETELESFDWDAPPPPPDEGPTIRFIPYDEAPVPIGGYLAIQKNVRYPEMAQQAGIEGSVIVQAFVDAKGRVTETVILKGIPNTGLNEAAAEAIRRTRFRPAKQRDRPVAVWISIPVNFKLKN